MPPCVKQGPHPIHLLPLTAATAGVREGASWARGQTVPSVNHGSPERHKVTMVVIRPPCSPLSPRAKCSVWNTAGTHFIGWTMNPIGWRWARTGKAWRQEQEWVDPRNHLGTELWRRNVMAAAQCGGHSSQEFRFVLVCSVSSLPFSLKHYMGAGDTTFLEWRSGRWLFIQGLEIPALSISQGRPAHTAGRNRPCRTSDKWPTNQLS